MDVFKFVYNKYLKTKILFDEVWYLTPCSPLIEEKDLAKACKSFTKVSTIHYWQGRVFPIYSMGLSQT